MKRASAGLAVLAAVAAAVVIVDLPPRSAVAGEAARSAEPPAVPPDGTAVWAYLQSAHYSESWAVWPGTEAFYEGTEPHGALLTTYVNDIARRSIEAGDRTLAPGSMVVKENYTPERALAATTVMYKAPGFDPDHDDWFWAKYAPDGAVQAAGRVATCIGCHGRAAGNDYIRTDRLGPKP